MPALTTPRIYLLQAPQVDWNEMERYFKEMDFGSEWLERWKSTKPGEDIEALTEFAARRCYRSFEPGLNPNVRRVRIDSEDYFLNLKTSAHGSVMEHGMFTFGLEDVSRVLTAELDRHRVGIAISEQSLRYVRLDFLRMWFPEWAEEDQTLMERNFAVLEVLENHQRWMSYHFGLEEDPEGIIQTGELWKERKKSFAFKKKLTSFMRRTAPLGLATGLIWSVNARALRHIISMRTGAGAEEEIRMVFGKIARMMIERYPLLFGDFYEDPDAVDNDGNYLPGVYTTNYWKV